MLGTNKLFLSFFPRLTHKNPRKSCHCFYRILVLKQGNAPLKARKILSMGFSQGQRFHGKKPPVSGRLCLTERLLLIDIVFLIELGNAAAAVNQLLFTREERVALRADFHLDFFFGRLSVYNFAA